MYTHTHTHTQLDWLLQINFHSTKFSSSSLRIHHNNEQLLVWDLWCLKNISQCNWTLSYTDRDVPLPKNCSCPASVLTYAIRFLRRPTVQPRRRGPGSISGEQSDRINVFLLRGPRPFSISISSPVLRTHSFVYHPSTLLCLVPHTIFTQNVNGSNLCFPLSLSHSLSIHIYIRKLFMSIILLLLHRNIFVRYVTSDLLPVFQFPSAPAVSTVQPHLVDIESIHSPAAKGKATTLWELLGLL
jgi:hypothetical protein